MLKHPDLQAIMGEKDSTGAKEDNNQGDRGLDVYKKFNDAKEEVNWIKEAMTTEEDEDNKADLEAQLLSAENKLVEAQVVKDNKELRLKKFQEEIEKKRKELESYEAQI